MLEKWLRFGVRRLSLRPLRYWRQKCSALLPAWVGIPKYSSAATTTCWVP